ncbi:hypothetical protein HFN76_18450 [Rhizobium laguerreae]|uniref:hypothetical protein n=1 Tax=Rhizobium laguerreae TaxID=1076926 RepID=UPI001C91BF95|nr:hypothetical protein [Rhizobium laguerreae]MBY3514194.1 hypothetical protein [Rhizobium laguerreae]
MSEDLNKSYGIPRLPDKVDEWERKRAPASLSDLDGNLAKTLTELALLAQTDLMKSALRAKNYIWAMDETGRIVLAVEELALTAPEAPYTGYPRRRGYRHPSEEKKLGHPTLLGEGHARIAGELAFDEDEEEVLHWVLNANSGRYCKQNPPSKAQVDQVAERFRELGVEVGVDYD